MKDSTPIELHRPPMIPINHKCHGLPGVVVPCASNMVSSSVAFQLASDCRDLMVRHSDTAFPWPSRLHESRHPRGRALVRAREKVWKGRRSRLVESSALRLAPAPDTHG